MPEEQLYFPGMEDLVIPKRTREPGPSLSARVKSLEDRVYLLEIELTVERKLNEKAGRDQ
jgi:hypothetical protein